MVQLLVLQQREDGLRWERTEPLQADADQSQAHQATNYIALLGQASRFESLIRGMRLMVDFWLRARVLSTPRTALPDPGARRIRYSAASPWRSSMRSMEWIAL